MEESRPWTRGDPPPPAGQPAPDPPADALDESDRPATVGDLRALRRWVIVATVWAVAASAIAIIALLDSPEETDDVQADVAAQLTRVRRALDERTDREIGQLRSQIRALPTTRDLQRLERRVQEAEQEGSKASSSASRALRSARSTSSALDDIERRVDRLEQEQDSGDGAPDAGRVPNSLQAP